MGKALATTGVFGIPAKIVDGKVRIKVNVRTDQEKQKDTAKLPKDSTVLLVDCPGGGRQNKETKGDALRREIFEETGGCTITLTGNFSPDPDLDLIKDGTTESPDDYAFWAPIVLHGDPKPSNEALDHPWVSREELETATKYRAVSGLGLKGRTGRMMVAALDFYEANKDKPELFS